MRNRAATAIARTAALHSSPARQGLSDLLPSESNRSFYPLSGICMLRMSGQAGKSELPQAQDVCTSIFRGWHLRPLRDANNEHAVLEVRVNLVRVELVGERKAASIAGRPHVGMKRFRPLVHFELSAALDHQSVPLHAHIEPLFRYTAPAGSTWRSQARACARRSPRRFCCVDTSIPLGSRPGANT